MRNAFEVFCSALGLIVLSPFLALVALAIKLEDGGPVLYTHMRMGKDFKPFGLLKFRTMVQNADRLGGPLTVAGDQRVTRVGRFLREYKIDELPQLWNVVKGDIQLVGARPQNVEYATKFRAVYAEVLRERPGITGPATLVYRDEEKIICEDPEKYYFEQILPHKLQLAVDYAKRRTFFSDLGIIFRTLMILHQPAPHPENAKSGAKSVAAPQRSAEPNTAVDRLSN